MQCHKKTNERLFYDFINRCSWVLFLETNGFFRGLKKWPIKTMAFSSISLFPTFYPQKNIVQNTLLISSGRR